MKTKGLLSLCAIAMLACTMSLMGCEKGDADKAKDAIDNAADKAGDAMDKAADKAGDAMDNAADKMNDALGGG
ncbi:MAG: hypothetical protein KC983_01095 [Phycisphaerales bacterium]|nr:hypothetical protein [Phycisphaerales bacterium]